MYDSIALIFALCIRKYRASSSQPTSTGAPVTCYVRHVFVVAATRFTAHNLSLTLCFGPARVTVSRHLL